MVNQYDDWVHVGWWHWWDGDMTKSGAFRYDHPEQGKSVACYVNKTGVLIQSEGTPAKVQFSDVIK
jgi:hypothetical protein